MKLTTPALCWTFFGTSMSLNMLAGSFFAMLPSWGISPRSTPDTQRERGWGLSKAVLVDS